MHIADPTLGIFGANGIVAAGLPIAVGAATAAQLRADGSVAVAFFGDGAVAQGAFHEAREPGRRLAAAGRLLLREQRLRRVLPGCRPSMRRRSSSGPPGTAFRYVAVDGNDVVATASVMEDVVGAVRDRRRARPWSRRPPTGGTATTRATPSATGRRRRSRSGEARDPLLVHEAAAAGRRASERRRDQGAGSLRWPTGSTAPSTPPGGWPNPAGGHARPTSSCGRGRRGRSRHRAGGRRAGVPHHGRHPIARSRPS